MSRRSSTTLKAKLRAIEMYQQGTETISKLEAKFHVSHEVIWQWVNRYVQGGVGAIAALDQSHSYTKARKIEAVEAYLRGEGSQMDICYLKGISAKRTLQDWIKKYNNHEEIRDFDPKGDVYMIKGRATTIEERIEIVKWCIAHEQSYKLTAERYKVSYGQIYAWVAKYLQRGEAGLTDLRGHQLPEVAHTPEEKQAQELKRLRVENDRLKMENEVLKKVKEIERRLYSEKYGKKRNI